MLEVRDLSLNSWQLKHVWLTFNSENLRVIRFLCLLLDLCPVCAKCFGSGVSMSSGELDLASYVKSGSVSGEGGGHLWY